MRRVQIRSTSAASRIAAQSLAPSHRRCRSPNEVVLCWLCPLSFCLYRFYHDLVSSPVFRPRPCLPLCSRVAYLCPRKPLTPPRPMPYSAVVLVLVLVALLQSPLLPPRQRFRTHSGPRDLISIFPIGNVPRRASMASRVRTKKGRGLRRPCGGERRTPTERARAAREDDREWR